MSYRAQDLFEIFPAQRSPMFLFAKHHGVVEIENNAAIGALQKVQL